MKRQHAGKIITLLMLAVFPFFIPQLAFADHGHHGGHERHEREEHEEHEHERHGDHHHHDWDDYYDGPVYDEGWAPRYQIRVNPDDGDYYTTPWYDDRGWN